MTSMRNAAVSVLARLGLLRPALGVLHRVKARQSGEPVETHADAGGLPLPDPRRIVAVNGNADVEAFLATGRLAASTVRETLARNGVAIDRLESMLDFGCGSGRVVRHWSDLPRTRVHGTDYNEDLIAWCTENLTFASFATNRLTPPLRYPDAAFDLVYAFSVFTHLPEDTQRPWLEELMRVLRPGGHLLFSTHGDFYIPSLRPDEQAAFAAGGLVVRYTAAAGTNLCAVFHPREYVRGTLAKGLDLVDFVAEGARGNPRQDLYLMRKR